MFGALAGSVGLGIYRLGTSPWSETHNLDEKARESEALQQQPHQVEANQQAEILLNDFRYKCYYGRETHRHLQPAPETVWIPTVDTEEAAATRAADQEHERLQQQPHQDQAEREAATILDDFEHWDDRQEGPSNFFQPPAETHWNL